MFTATAGLFTKKNEEMGLFQDGLILYDRDIPLASCKGDATHRLKRRRSTIRLKCEYGE
jgi:hypothetical protein